MATIGRWGKDGLMFEEYLFWDNAKPDRFGPLLTTSMLFFLVEMADKTQLATVALAARFQSVVLVTTGTTLGMLASDGLAVFLGERLARKVPMKWIRIGAGSLFFASARRPSGPSSAAHDTRMHPRRTSGEPLASAGPSLPHSQSLVEIRWVTAGEH